MAYQHALVAVDFSPECAVLVEKARQIVAAGSGRVSLVHVVELSPVGMAGELMYDPVMLDPMPNAEQGMATFAARVGVAAADAHVQPGDTRYEVHRLAQALGADVIVVGSHGRHGLALLLGSTANGMLHGAACDVLAVRIHK